MEDLTDSIEVIVFPRVFADYKELIVTDRIILVDGKIDFSRPWTGPIGKNDFPVCIGENIELKGRCFHGLIDDVRIYDYALSEKEIVEFYNGSH